MLISAVSRGFRADEVTEATCCEMSAQNPAKPQPQVELRRHNAQLRSENATRGQMSDEDLAKPQREWNCEPANARRRRENDSTMGTSDRVKRSEVAFSAPPRGPKTRSAPQENPPQAKNGPRHASRKRIEHFSFRLKNFSQTFRGHVLPTEDATAQTQ